jgi:phospholipid/cholesterol/gamma-HCH transport system substrate-binding protein
MFENVQGLHVGDQVDMLGKKIGKVTKTRFMAQKIAVELAIDNSFSFSIPIDSKIEVKSEGIIGSKFISITPGYNRKDYILPGTIVEGLREFDLTEITPDIVPMTQDLSAFARQLKAVLGKEEGDKIRLTIKNIESFTAQLDSLISAKDKNNFQTTMKNLRDVTAELKEGINKEIDKLDQMLNSFKAVTDKSDELSTTISELRKSSESFSSATQKLDMLLTKIENGEGTLGKLVNNDTLHENMNSLVNEVRTLVQDFKENPTKYMKAYWKGKKK